MTDEIGKKRSVIVIGTDAQGLLKEGDDIPSLDKDVKVPLGSPAPMTLESASRYLRGLVTDGRDGNKFTVDAGQTTLSLRDAMGRPATIIPASGNSSAFATAHELGIIAETFDATTIAKIHDPTTSVQELIRAIVSNPRGELLKADGTKENVSDGKAGVSDSPNASELQKKISGVLRRNRFNPDPGSSPYISGQAASTVDGHPLGKSQLNLGGYDNRPVTSATGITYEQMKKVGLALMLRSTGGRIGGTDGDPTSAGVGSLALIPGAAQLTATRIVDRKSMWAADLSDAQGKPPGISDKPNLESDISLDNGTKSYGSLNTFIEPFSGFAPVGMTALGAALVVATKLVLLGFVAIFGGLTSATQVPGLLDTDSPNTVLVPGESRARTKLVGGLVSLEDFGIHTVKHDYITAVNRGSDVFFQFDGVNFVRVVKSPGYYVVLVRAIARSVSEIIGSITDAVASGNPIAAVQNLIGIVDVIKASKLVGFMNILAGLGDNVLTLEDNGFISVDANGSDADAGNLPNNGKISIQDRFVLNPVTRVMKSREDASATTLAWRTSATPSTYLLPTNAINAATIFSKGKNSLSNVGSIMDAQLGVFDTQKSIGESVKTIEDALDSEYVPFYFHDLRTSEVISFHAFLSAINESYSANYDSSKHYGRVDPVMVYTDTDRQINLTFNVVATNPEDFDVMWWKINKLVTLLYPQWSQGRKLVVNQDTFIQPFSQIPTASPMVRIRLGDLLRSNYSKFALARLFGLGSSDFSLQGSQPQSQQTTANEQKLAEAKAAIQKRMRDDDHNATVDKPAFNITEGALLKAQGHRRAPLQPLTPPTPRPGGSRPNLIQRTFADFPVTISGPAILKPGAGNTKKLQYVITIKNSPLIPADRYLGPYIVDHEDLAIDNNEVDRLARLQTSQLNRPATAEEQAVENFFAAENNAIVRSFESVRGRGLAGFITSMNIDWHAATWETKFGSRAPQYCSIAMTFKPIHDIAPGIDNDGFNRAPLYNVGNIVKDVASDPYGEDDAGSTNHQTNVGAIEKNTKNNG